MRKNSKNEKVIRAMAIGISAMLMASSPLTALAAEGEGNSSEGNEDKNITVTPEAGVCDQAEAAAKDADKAVELYPGNRLRRERRYRGTCRQQRPCKIHYARRKDTIIGSLGV